MDHGYYAGFEGIWTCLDLCLLDHPIKERSYVSYFLKGSYDAVQTHTVITATFPSNGDVSSKEKFLYVKKPVILRAILLQYLEILNIIPEGGSRRCSLISKQMRYAAVNATSLDLDHNCHRINGALDCISR